MQTKIAQVILFWFGVSMAALFLLGGFLFIATDFLIEHLPSPNRTYLGLILIAYSGFRGYRQYAMYKRNMTENEE